MTDAAMPSPGEPGMSDDRAAGSGGVRGFCAAAATDFRDVAALVDATRSGRVRVADVAAAVLDALALARRPEAWIEVVAPDELRRRADELDSRRAEAASLPLFGVPFAIKDNIDVAGMPTSAGCPAFACVPATTAFAVELLLDAGALLVGRTHMDQFATGLVGTRSPYGPCRNAHDATAISGGSSSGSAVAVAEGIVAFALGTDTAGSGRVPAVLNGVTGLKPTKGRVSTRGVVPACASLDCVSVFAASARDAATILGVLDVFDEDDPASRPDRPLFRGAASSGAAFRFGVPRELPPVVGGQARALFDESLGELEAAGGRRVEFDYAPFAETAALLYGGGWTAERDASFGDFLRAHRDAVDPAVARIVLGGEPSGRQVFESMHALEALRRRAGRVWNEVDVIVVPTVCEAWRIADVLARPLEASADFGVTNNFVNLLDLAALAVPTGSFAGGAGFGVTLCAPAWSEARLLALGDLLERRVARKIPRLERPSRILLAVVGAHLEGMPLHFQLAALDARLVERTRTAPAYRLHALANTSPAKPGLERVASGGAAIEVEVYALAPEAFGRFVAGVARPLAIGRVELDGGIEVSGFVCEPAGLANAQDITGFGGWRAWCAR